MRRRPLAVAAGIFVAVAGLALAWKTTEPPAEREAADVRRLDAADDDGSRQTGTGPAPGAKLPPTRAGNRSPARAAAPSSAPGAAPTRYDELPTTLAALPSGAPLPSAPPGRPGSLRGTQTDGGFVVDGSGRLVPSVDARLLFDHLLSATGEESPAVLRARIEAEIRKRLKGDAVRDAIALLDRYLTYRDRVRTAAADMENLPLEARIDRLWQIRREALGPADADAFFADERALELAALETRRAVAESTGEERARRLRAAEELLPENLRQARAEALAPLRQFQDEQALRARGGSAADVRKAREDAFGSEAADRLAQLDQERAAFDRKLAEYRAARAKVQADASLDAAARARAVDALMKARFSEPERVRVKALDEIAAAAGK